MHTIVEPMQPLDAGFGLLFDAHVSVMLLIDSATNMIWKANQAAAHFYGYPASELCTMSISQLCTSQPEEVAHAYQRAAQKEQNRFVQEHRLANGNLHTVEVAASPLTLNGQHLLCAIISDLTEYVRSTEVLKQSELRYQLLMDALNVSVCRWLPDTTLLFANEQYRTIFGIPGEANGQQWLNFLPPSVREKTAAFCYELVKNPCTVRYEHPVTINDGQVRHYQWIDTPIFDAAHQLIEFQSVGMDITDRLHAKELSYVQHDLEVALRDSEELYRTLINCQESAIITIDANGVFHYINQIGAALLETIPAMVVGKSLHDFIPAQIADNLCTVIRQVISSGQGITDEIQHPIKDQLRWYHTSTQPLRDADGKVVLAMVNALDITEHKLAEEQLRQSEVRFRALIEYAPGAITLVGADGKLTFISSSSERVMGYDPEAMIGVDPAHLTHPDDLPAVLALLNELMAIPGDVRVAQYRFRHANGSWRWVESTMSNLLYEPSVNAIAINFQDITERKYDEQKLRELNQTLEERVRQRTAEVQDLYENAPVGYHALDAQGTVLMVNQTQMDMLGYTREELLGQSADRFLAPQSIEIFAGFFQILKERGSVRDLELEMLHKNGRLIPVLLRATAVYNEHGEFVMSRSTVFDNSERKHAEIALRESEEQNRLLFEESPDAVVLFREDGTLAQLNRAFEELTGYSSSQLIGQSLASVGLVTHETIRQITYIVNQHIQTSPNVATIEIRFRHANGEYRDVGMRVFGITIRGQHHYLATMRDITTEKQVEETLRQANTALAQAARAKDDFLANMSHELRTPLNAILGLSEMLLEEIRGPLNPRQQASIRTIEVSGQHLLELINDILDLSKIEAGQMEIQVEAVSVSDVCQSSLLFIKEQAIKKSLRLDFTLNDHMAEMEADPRRLKQMLVNLLSNAVKFTPDNGQVRLDVDIDAHAGVICFAVQDTGIGISSEDLARLFQPFRQLDSSLSRQHEGSGLGLALVRRLAELHGGSISVESTIHQGSCFRISLPYHTVQTISKDTHPYVSNLDHPSRHIHSALVVEDSESAAEQLARYLQEANVHVFVHHQGEGALEQAIRIQPHIIFLDLLMPDRSGWDVLAQLKTNPRTRSIPVVIISVVDNRTAGLAAGASEHLVKPITRAILNRTLQSIITTTKREEQQALVIVPNPPPSPNSTRIMLVEDNEINILTMSEYLQEHGFALSVARNGHEALNQIDQNQPDLILMDIQMPEMDGIEVTRRLRAIPAYMQVPIIALTALAMPGDRERCLEAGANEYLTKPVRMKGLVETIRYLLHQ